jgi:biopolymer transport protein ExbD
MGPREQLVVSAVLASLSASSGCKGSDGSPSRAGAASSALPVVTIDLPKAAAGSWEPTTVFTVTLTADGKELVDGVPVANDEEILSQARSAVAKAANVSAAIMADAAVPHGRVVHVIDLLRQSGISKVGFGVAVPAPQPVSP